MQITYFQLIIKPLKPWRRGLGSGIVFACGAMGRDIESRQGREWYFDKPPT
jgi:hypothetical protein